MSFPITDRSYAAGLAQGRAEAAELAREIERLRALIESECRRAEDAHGNAQYCSLENERLRKQMKQLAFAADHAAALLRKAYPGAAQSLSSVIAQAKAIIERKGEDQ